MPVKVSPRGSVRVRKCTVSKQIGGRLRLGNLSKQEQEHNDTNLGRLRSQLKTLSLSGTKPKYISL